ncbi:MAG: nuclear transport factor 2 family protein [Sneathiellales bacterium]|nr:nuclear transport factor 2 family protein [Sneathiellales bacterium]
MTPNDHKQILSLIGLYCDGLYHADSTVLRKVFHPELAYICATEGDELYLDLETYMARIDTRTPPSERGEPREEALLDVAFGSDRIARVTARMSMMGRDYLDFLTLIRDGDEWRIVTKVFTYIPRKAG